MRPTVYIGGGTAAGKSSLARDLAEHFGLDTVSASVRLVGAMGDSGRSRADRLRSWLVREHHISRSAGFDRDTDFRLLHQIDAAPAGMIVDSSYLSLLLSPVNSALTIWVDASAAVRAARLAAIVPDVDDVGRRLIVDRKDAGTAAAVRSAWGLEVARPDLWQLRHDLVMCCPEPDKCSDPADCARALREIGEHAVEVYLTYCREPDASRRGDAEKKMADLRAVCDRRKPWVRVISSALLAPEAGSGPEQWRRRTCAGPRAVTYEKGTMNAVDVVQAGAAARSAYFAGLIDVMQRLEKSSRRDLDQAVELCAEAVARGRRLYIYDTRRMLGREVANRSGGLVAFMTVRPNSSTVEPLAKPIDELEPGGVLIVCSVTGVSHRSVQAALTARQMGCRTIALTSRTFSTNLPPEHPSGQRLLDAVDLVLDNGAEYGDAFLTLPGFSRKVAATSGIAGAALLGALTVGVTERLLERGIEPSVYQSIHLPGGQEDVAHSEERYQRLGH